MRTIGNAKAHEGLFLVEVDSSLVRDKFHTASITSSHCPKDKLISPKDEPIMLWHYRPGHPNFLYLRRMFPSLFKNKSPTSFQHEVCQFSKHIRYIKILCPFSMIHSNIWEPSKENHNLRISSNNSTS